MHRLPDSGPVSRLCALFLVAGLVLLPRPVRGDLGPELTPDTYAAIRHALLPAEEERRWEGIGWHPTLWDGVIQAHRGRMPMLVWVTEGHPLGQACADGIQGRRTIWSSAAIEVMVRKNLVAAADTVGRLQSKPGAEATLFQRFVDRVVSGGQVRPAPGIYLVTPSGLRLGMTRSADPDHVAGAIREALEAWEKTPERDRFLTVDPVSESAYLSRPEKEVPHDGLVLRITTRDLPAGPDPVAAERGWWNRDFAWFRKEEARRFLPSSPAPGMRLELPGELILRLAQFHLVDFARGQGRPFDAPAVERASLTCHVESVKRGVARIRYEGATRAAQEGRGLETRLLGWAEVDLESGRFRTFDLVAVGTRWGSDVGGRRADDRGPTPIGFAFTLAGAGAGEWGPPAFVSRYGW